ncbi:pancreatic lipase-related protein 2-like [Diadema setosum]|uniref:pancreatic lipase-related protein 2-like n=1 Tax=Diadema setosum TaxID=31175 RepID=UPI003B3A78BC
MSKTLRPKATPSLRTLQDSLNQPDSSHLFSEKQTCYKEVGCFTSRLLSCHPRAPQSPRKIQATMILFTRANRDRPDGERLSYTHPTMISRSTFDPTKETKIAIHGYLDSHGSEHWLAFSKAMLDAFDVNLIMVDWSKAAKTIDYEQSRADIRVVGVLVANLIEMIHSETGASPVQSVHLIGHSLGAHAAGYAGEACSELVGRITGLDPAGPGFTGLFAHDNCRLSSGDAMFVDVIHTNGRPMTKGGAGLMEQLGNQDFYPNGGQEQPGGHGTLHGEPSRTGDQFRSTRKANTWKSLLASGHYLECGDDADIPCPEMGYWSNWTLGVGAFYLETNAESRFSQD